MAPTNIDPLASRPDAGNANQPSFAGGARQPSLSQEAGLDVSGTSSGTGSGDAAATLSDLKNRTKDQAHEAYEQVQQFKSQAMDKARESWTQTSGALSDRTQQLADAGKSRAAAGIQDIVRAARAAADALEERNDPTVAGYARSLADSLDQAGGYLQNADVSDLWREVNTFTRRRPEWVVGGAFVVGLALARFLKADRRGPQRRDHPPESADPHVFDDVYRSQLGEGEFGQNPYGGGGYGSGQYGGQQSGRQGSEYGSEFGGLGGSGTSGSGGAGYGTAAGSLYGGTTGLSGESTKQHGDALTGETLPLASGAADAGDDQADDDLNDLGLGVTDTRNAAPGDVDRTNAGDSGRKGGI